MIESLVKTIYFLIRRYFIYARRGIRKLKRLIRIRYPKFLKRAVLRIIHLKRPIGIKYRKLIKKTILIKTRSKRLFRIGYRMLFKRRFSLKKRVSIIPSISDVKKVDKEYQFLGKKISVLVITRNRAHLLTRCLLSLTTQTRMPDEVIIVDNASTDNTQRVIASFKNKLPIISVYEKIPGIPMARNKGLSQVTGDIVLMIDDDCKASTSWIARMIKMHKKYPLAWIIQGRTFSTPPDRLYSQLAEFNRYLSLKSHMTPGAITLENFFEKELPIESPLVSCDTRNFSMKTYYLLKYNLRFDEDFYRGSDSDFGRQIVKNGGAILFSSQIRVNHLERPKLQEFLEQRWHIGRTSLRIDRKWSFTDSLQYKALLKQKLVLFILYCKTKRIQKLLLILIPLFFLDRLFYLNGRFYEKRLSLHDANTNIKQVE